MTLLIKPAQGSVARRTTGTNYPGRGLLCGNCYGHVGGSSQHWIIFLLDGLTPSNTEILEIITELYLDCSVKL